MKEDSMIKFKKIIEDNLNFGVVLRRHRKLKKAFLAYLERALMYMRMYGKFRLAAMEFVQFHDVLENYDPESHGMFLMDNTTKMESSTFYDPKDIDYLRSLNVYSHSERKVREALTKDVIKQHSPSYLIGLYNKAVEGCGEEDKDIWKLFWIDDLFLDEEDGLNDNEYCEGYHGW